MTTAAGYYDFLKGLMADPKAVSAPTPSSAALGRAMAEEVDLQRDGLVLELGPGTGVVTQALLQHGVPASRLIAIEQTPYFANLMAQRFPGVDTRQGDALRFEDVVPQGANVAAIVSGLPLLQFPVSVRQSLLARGLAVLGQGGRFIQLSYSWRAPAPPVSHASIRHKTVWRNLPPAHVWIYGAYTCDCCRQDSDVSF